MWKRFMPWFAVAGVAMVLVLAATLTSADAPPAQAAKGPKEPKDPPMQPAGVAITPSRVAAVTVYPGSALVSREVDVPPGKGLVELTVSPLPPTIINSSLYSEGSDGIRVLTTRYRSRPIQQDTRADVAKLLAELAQLSVAREKLESDIKAIGQNLAMLGKMEGFMSVTTIQGTEKGVLNAEAAITLSKHIKEQRIETSRELVTLKQQVKANMDKAEFAQRKLGEVNTGTPRTERDAVIVVDRTNPAAGKVRLNYLVTSASWRPQYKLRASKVAKDPVQVEYLASLVQHSGEDWNNVSLTLSTAQPMLNAAPPELQSLNVGVVHLDELG
ncbi:MAG: mucoidy inhibitor MuiA family protein [Gemmataceae bacterium]|nr:mucoidy inhibitor MuiA family protein [Gemmataceae bacterium]